MFRECSTFEVPYQYVERIDGNASAVVAGVYLHIICSGEGDSPEDVGPTGNWPPEPDNKPGGIGKDDDDILDDIENLVDEDCWEKMDPNLRKTIVDLVNTQLMNPCEPTLSPGDLISQAISDACEESEGSGSGGEGADDEEVNLGDSDNHIFIEDLEETTPEHILLDSSFTGNQKLNCLWQKLVQDDNPLFCTTLSNFFGDSEFDLELTTAEFIDEANAYTIMTESKNYIEIRFNQDNIENRCNISIHKTILHEGVHAEMYRKIKLITEYENVNPNDFSTLWEAYRSSKQWSHDYMSIWYLDKIEIALKDIYGDQYTDEQYSAIAWEGLDEIEYERLDGTIEYVPITQKWASLDEPTKQAIRDLQDGINDICEKLCSQ